MRIAKAFFVAAAVVSSAAAQERVPFKPEVGHPTFAVREPVLKLKPGTILVSNTMMGPYYTEEGGAFPGEVGPFEIVGADRRRGGLSGCQHKPQTACGAPPAVIHCSAGRVHACLPGPGRICPGPAEPG